MRHCVPGMPFPPGTESSLQLAGGKASPAWCSCENMPWICSPNLTLPCSKESQNPLQVKKMESLEASEQHWGKRNSPKINSAAGFKVPGWCLGGSGAPVGSYHKPWCPSKCKILAPGKLTCLSCFCLMQSSLCPGAACAHRTPLLAISIPHEVPSVQCKCKSCLLTWQSRV